MPTGNLAKHSWTSTPSRHSTLILPSGSTLRRWKFFSVSLLIKKEADNLIYYILIEVATWHTRNICCTHSFVSHRFLSQSSRLNESSRHCFWLLLCSPPLYLASNGSMVHAWYRYMTSSLVKTAPSPLLRSLCFSAWRTSCITRSWRSWWRTPAPLWARAAPDPRRDRRSLEERRVPFRFAIQTKCIYRETLVVEYIGCVDLVLGSSPGWWADTVATYCPSRMVEHPKSKST